MTHLAVKRGSVLRGYVYRFITLFAPTLERQMVEKLFTAGTAARFELSALNSVHGADLLKMFLSLLALVNPLGAIPFFISFTTTQSDRESARRLLAWPRCRSCW